MAEPSSASRLTAEERRTLIRAARGAIAHAIAHGATPTPGDLALNATPSLERPGASFVTLRRPNRRLRGCIGEILAERPLLESVIDNAVRAARRDPRFEPVEAGELPELQLEVSILTPPVEIPTASGIEVGRHGVLLEIGDHRAVFLPQVATEQEWTRERLLDELARKAGLAPEAWRDGARLSVFEAEKFGETDLTAP